MTTHRVPRRGDNIPDVSAYAHWNEDAERVWYEENKYDMEHADEVLEDEWYEQEEDDPDPFEESFPTEAAAQAFYDSLPDTPRDPPQEWKGTWYVEHYDRKAHERLRKERARV